MTMPSLLPSFQLWVNAEKKYVLKAYGGIADIYWNGREFDTLNEALWGLEKEVTFSDGGRSLDPQLTVSFAVLAIAIAEATK